MNFAEAVSNVYRNYFNFSGRAQRSEYWWFFLFSIIVSVIITVVETALGLGQGAMMRGGGGFEASYNGGPLSMLWSLVNLIPALALSVRRLHDTDRSGWWLLIGLVPLIGVIVLIVFFASKGYPGANRFGDDPRA